MGKLCYLKQKKKEEKDYTFRLECCPRRWKLTLPATSLSSGVSDFRESPSKKDFREREEREKILKWSTEIKFVSEKCSNGPKNFGLNRKSKGNSLLI